MYHNARVALVLMTVLAGSAACGVLPSGGPNNVSTGSTTSTTSTGMNPNDTTKMPTPMPPPMPPACPTPANANDFFGSPRCCNTKALVCDDFESAPVGGNPNAALWMVQKDNDQNDLVEITTAHAARGSKALHIHAVNGGGERAVIVNTSLFPAQHFFGRAFFWWDTPTRPNNHATYVAAGPNPNPGYDWLRFSSFGSGNLGANESNPDDSASSNVPSPMGRWGCLEWEYDATNKVAHYWLDNVLVDTFNFQSNFNFGQVFIGWEIYTHDGTESAWDMYYDEIALDTKRIGCQN